MTECFYVATELAREGRIYVPIRDFYVATEFTTIERFSTHNRAGSEKAGAHENVAPCCVVTEEARRA